MQNGIYDLSTKKLIYHIKLLQCSRKERGKERKKIGHRDKKTVIRLLVIERCS